MGPHLLQKWLPVTGRLQFVQRQYQRFVLFCLLNPPRGHRRLQQRSERVLQPSLQQHQSSVLSDRGGGARTGLMSKAMAMETATSEVLGKCMISESAYVSLFLFVRAASVWYCACRRSATVRLIVHRPADSK